MTAREPLRLAILISGRGSNMAAIARACAEGRLGATVDVVIADRAGIAGLDTARSMGIPTAVVPWKALGDRGSAERMLTEMLDAHRPDVVALAGFMRILSPAFVQRYAGRMLNIHPSLLPRYTGLDTHRRVLAAGDSHHGASVHFVTEELDGGPLVLQSRITLRPDDTEETVSGRVHATEHIIYPKVVGWLAQGRLAWRDGAPWLDGRPLTQPVVEEFPDD
jgi:phosphoribosylglycinamide formyltransferase-1